MKTVLSHSVPICIFQTLKCIIIFVSRHNEMEMKIKFCIACSRGHSAGHFGTKNMYIAQFLTELLRILSFKTCIMKN